MTDHALAGRKIALALSGGGTRAMAFHAGVIRYLADDGILHQVNHISSVSGGSLLVGLVLKIIAMEMANCGRIPDSDSSLRSAGFD
jgi:NTE family protein